MQSLLAGRENMSQQPEKAQVHTIPAAEAVLVPGNVIPSTPIIHGHDFNRGRDLDSIMASMVTTGFQATALGEAIEEVNRMLRWRLSDEAIAPECEPDEAEPSFRAGVRTKVFLAYTSNLISAGVREHIRYLVEHRMVDVLVTTAGGVEEDLIKCMGHTYVGDFSLKGSELRPQGLNRIGNMLVPNNNYCAFEDWIMPILDDMLREQQEQHVNWTPSKMIARFGKEINNPESVYYWAWKNNIPVFSPALTDGSIGDMLFFHSYKNPGLRCDLIEDIRRINDEAMKVQPPRKTGVIILGGGVPKHHVFNANLMRNGADFAVVLSTAQEYDGSDSGAKPDEAVSWGKIRMTAKPVKVSGDATILFPLLISQTFAKTWQPRVVAADGGVGAAANGHGSLPEGRDRRGDSASS